MPLKDIFCQEKAVASLEQAYDSGKVAHAYIFAGPDGVGKFTTAREFARMLLCKNPVITAEHAEDQPQRKIKKQTLRAPRSLR